MANEIDINQSDALIDPPERHESLLDKVIRTGTYTGLGYGGLVGAKSSIKHLTPLTQTIASPLKKASTRIEGYYKPGVGGKDKFNLLVDHWKKSDLPTVTEYLTKYGNTRDPFGVPWRGGVTEVNINRLRTMMGKYGTIVGLNGGIETADELKFATKIQNANNSYWEAINSGDVELERQATRLMERNKNLLRYEMQKTELIKHSFGEKINQTRWKSSGLGKLKTTTLSSALDDNSRALRSWINSSKFMGRFGGVTPETKVTVAQYTGKDHATLMRNAKNFGASYIKDPFAAPKDMYGNINKIRKINGIKHVSENAFTLYENGATRQQVNRFVDSMHKVALNDKTKNMLTQFKNHHDFVDGKLKVNYSFVSTQQTVAGVNSDLTIWRGKGTSPAGKARVSVRGAGSTGKLYHIILVSDMYDVAGGMGATTQKNLHMNIARGTNAGPNALKFAKYEGTKQQLYKTLVNKETGKLTKLLPKVSKKMLMKLAKVLVFKRI